MDLSRFGYRPDYNPDNKRVGSDYVTYDGNKYWISTVDMGLDHQFGDGPPLWYETMIFAVDDDDINFHELYCNRYTTREQASESHALLVKAFNEGRMVFQDRYFEFSEGVAI